MTALHPEFGKMLNNVFPPQPYSHRGWSIDFVNPPIPCRDFDWCGTHPDFDGAEDANDDRVVHGRTREAVMAAIDDWYAAEEAL